MQTLMNLIEVVNLWKNSAILLLNKIQAGNSTEHGKISVLGKTHSGSLVGFGRDFHMASFPTQGEQRKYKR